MHSDVTLQCTYIIEAADHSAGTDDEGQRVSALTAAVELGAVVQEACVVHLDRVAVGSDSHSGSGRAPLLERRMCDCPTHGPVRKGCENTATSVAQSREGTPTRRQSQRRGVDERLHDEFWVNAVDDALIVPPD